MREYFEAVKGLAKVFKLCLMLVEAIRDGITEKKINDVRKKCSEIAASDEELFEDGGEIEDAFNKLCN